MTDRKTIAVVGATGAQGGSLVRSIIADAGSEYAVRALTRNPQSDKAQELADLGAEVVAADVDDGDSLKAAFDGAYGAFCVTFFWDHMSPEKELAHAQLMAQAAKEKGVEHVIWSTLEDTRRWVPLDDDRMPTLMGKYKVPHFDSKGEANSAFTDIGVPTTLLNTSFYWDNFIHFGMGPKKDEEGRYALTLPMGDKRLAAMAAEDIGKCAHGLFKRGVTPGEELAIAGEHLTGSELAAGLSEALDIDVYYNPVSPEAYRGFGFPGAEDLGNMFQFFAEFETDFCGARDLAASRALNPELQTFKEWLALYGDQIPLD